MNWKAGDEAILDFNLDMVREKYYKYQGNRCMLLEYQGKTFGADNTFTDQAWLVLIQDGRYLADERVLRKPPYDGHVKTTWDKIPYFTPKELVKVKMQH